MFEQVVNILFPVIALVGVGFMIGRWQKPDFRPINRINMDAFVPALVFSSLATMPLDTQQLPLIAASLVAVLIPALLMIPICLMMKINYKAWAPLHMFRNSGNLAIPLFTYTFGESALGSAVLLFVVSACLHISLGLALLSKGNPFKQIISTPLFIAAAIAMILNVLGITVWKPLYEATSLLGQAAVPVMLISLGSQMINLKLSGFKVGVISSLLSLATGAVSFLLIYYFIPLPTMQLQMMVLFTMLPPAVMNYLFAERFNIEPTNVASMVLFGNFFCLITLPILLTVALLL
ncbi:AEC family transporter [Vibrio aestuarianus]|uniref:Membrane protein n=1 Tax=Vibrio aestuarianus TaxID=28171 RepID=A0ABN8TQM1_9VIBR|nr:AEC family transporter [Vibrio aestuarianus]MDE1215091.1 AEC family transporter [Vibrio aestuarianus]MDE1216647.1 AEC family transporter [Vibrio aestuarianus]MDE1227916.1 AEC family transporter [Vibrio aestuarianus]MDE1256389.1 AEC family transporter [Vibrio aestuarianus]MDE1262208.1 AEC family transporter [Vibrio aestuarianus]